MSKLDDNQIQDIVTMIIDEYGTLLLEGELSEITGLILENISGFETVGLSALTQTESPLVC